MPRRPPQKPDARGPRATKDLPNKPDARKTWSGPPAMRSPGRWSGAIDCHGKIHVGTYDTPREWGIARDRLVAERLAGHRRESDDSLSGVTIAEFVGAKGSGWPWNSKGSRGKRSQPSTYRHHEDQIQALVRAFGDRPIKGGIRAREAQSFCTTATENQMTSAIALFNDAWSLDTEIVSPFRNFSRSRTRGRKDLIDILSEAELTRLKEIAVDLTPDGHGQVIAAMVDLEGHSGARPGEVFAMDPKRIDRENSMIYIKWAVKKDGRLGPPKNEQERWLVLAPSTLELIDALPKTDSDILFPTKTGRRFGQSNWTTYWHPLRDAFTTGLPEDHWLRMRIADQTLKRLNEPDPQKRKRIPDGKLDYYELRHRAFTWMATPRPDGLGLSAPDIAIQAGHTDGGALVERVYIHRNKDLARARVLSAMRDYRPDQP